MLYEVITLDGIHSVRACANFTNSLPFHKEWYAAMGLVKLACYNTYQKLAAAAHNRHKEELQMTAITSYIIHYTKLYDYQTK